MNNKKGTTKKRVIFVCGLAIGLILGRRGHRRSKRVKTETVTMSFPAGVSTMLIKPERIINGIGIKVYNMETCNFEGVGLSCHQAEQFANDILDLLDEN